MDSDEECIKILRAVIEEVKDDLHLVRQLEGHLEDAFKRLFQLPNVYATMRTMRTWRAKTY